MLRRMEIYPLVYLHLLASKKIDGTKLDPISLHWLLLSDANELLLQRHRPEAVVEVEEASLLVHPQEGCHVLIVGQGGRETNQPHLLLSRLNVPDGTSHKSLQDRTSLVMQEMDLVKDDESHQLRVRPVPTLPWHEVQFLKKNLISVRP